MRLKINEKWSDEVVAHEIGASVLAHQPDQSELELAKILDAWMKLNEPSSSRIA